jgi:membrane protein implicated in regulation of membrane protease activity
MMQLRIAFALAGFVAALFSVALEDDRLAWAAIALLAVSLILRLVLRRRSHESRGTDEQV